MSDSVPKQVKPGLTNAELRAEPVDVVITDSGGSSLLLATEATIAKKMGMGTGFYADKILTVVTDQEIAAPTSGQRLRLKWLHLYTRETNSAPNEITVKLGNIVQYLFELGSPGIFSRTAPREGVVDAKLTVSTSAAQAVYINAEWEEFI
jgi:hypothetical protein